MPHHAFPTVDFYRKSPSPDMEKASAYTIIERMAGSGFFALSERIRRLSSGFLLRFAGNPAYPAAVRQYGGEAHFQYPSTERHIDRRSPPACHPAVPAP